MVSEGFDPIVRVLTIIVKENIVLQVFLLFRLILYYVYVFVSALPVGFHNALFL